MLVINNGYIEYNTSHLDVNEVTTFEKMLERLKNLETNLFYNIVSSSNCRYEKGAGKGRIKEEFKDFDAENRFKNIIKSKKLYGNPKGFFVNKNAPSTNCRDIQDIRSVSFTLSKMEDIPQHFEARGSEFGICFYHDFLQNNGIRPVIYIESDDDSIKAKMIFNSPYLIEVSSQKYNMKWENEWRVNGDLEFDLDDIAFVIVPSEEYDQILDWSLEEGLELQILTSLTYKSYLEHLFFIPKMDKGWSQIRYCVSDGFKMDPYEIVQFTSKELREFGKKHYNELICLAKNTILDCYEHKYMAKFNSFLKKINRNKLSQELESKFSRFIKHQKEPFVSESNLVNSLYTELFYLDSNR